MTVSGLTTASAKRQSRQRRDLQIYKGFGVAVEGLAEPVIGRVQAVVEVERTCRRPERRLPNSSLVTLPWPFEKDLETVEGGGLAAGP
jgi:hypothetical protein